MHVDQLSSMSMNDRWRVNRQTLNIPSTTKHKSNQGFFPENKVVIRRRDFAVDETNTQGALHYIDLELNSELAD